MPLDDDAVTGGTTSVPPPNPASAGDSSSKPSSSDSGGDGGGRRDESRSSTASAQKHSRQPTLARTSGGNQGPHSPGKKTRVQPVAAAKNMRPTSSSRDGSTRTLSSATLGYADGGSPTAKGHTTPPKDGKSGSHTHHQRDKHANTTLRLLDELFAEDSKFTRNGKRWPPSPNSHHAPTRGSREVRVGRALKQLANDVGLIAGIGRRKSIRLGDVTLDVGANVSMRHGSKTVEIDPFRHGALTLHDHGVSIGEKNFGKTMVTALERLEAGAAQLKKNGTFQYQLQLPYALDVAIPPLKKHGVTAQANVTIESSLSAKGVGGTVTVEVKVPGPLHSEMKVTVSADENLATDKNSRRVSTPSQNYEALIAGALVLLAMASLVRARILYLGTRKY